MAKRIFPLLLPIATAAIAGYAAFLNHCNEPAMLGWFCAGLQSISYLVAKVRADLWKKEAHELLEAMENLMDCTAKLELARTRYETKALSHE